jgi:hypothetical protein
MATTKKKPSEDGPIRQYGLRYLNEWGVPYFGTDTSPYWSDVKAIEDSDACPPCAKEAMLKTYADLDSARALALTIYGPAWREYVIPLYDRLIACRERLDEADR